MDLNGGIPMLALLRENEDLARLPQDPRRFMRAPMDESSSRWGIGSAVVLTIVIAIVAVALSRPWSDDFDNEDLTTAVFGAAAIIACWYFVWSGRRGIGDRRAFYEAYPRLRGSGLVPSFGYIIDTEVNPNSDADHIEHCTIDVQLDDGRQLHAARHRDRALEDANGVRIVRGLHQAPQFGDRVAVFEDPTGVMPVLVTTQRPMPAHVRRGHGAAQVPGSAHSQRDSGVPGTPGEAVGDGAS